MIILELKIFVTTFYKTQNCCNKTFYKDYHIGILEGFTGLGTILCFTLKGLQKLDVIRDRNKSNKDIIILSEFKTRYILLIYEANKIYFGYI